MQSWLLAVTLAMAPEPTRLELMALLARAARSPKVAMAREAAAAAEAKRREVSRIWLPQVEVLAVGGPSPEVRCIPDETNCDSTEPKDLRLAFDGIFYRFDARATAPIYSFGKMGAGTRAADAGVRIQRALGDAARADALLEAARAYYGLKLARELLIMLEEGAETVDQELKRVDEALAKGGGDVTEADRHRLRAVRAEIDARRAEARRGEGTALAGVRLYAGDDGADVDEAPLAPLAPAAADPRAAREEARQARPELRAAQAGADAAAALADLEWSKYFPDLVLVAQGTWARATHADDPENAYAADPLNVSSLTAGVMLRWVFDLGVRGPRVDAARAGAAGARALAEFARRGVAFEAERAAAELADARDRLAASAEGEKAARAWLAASSQAAAAGLAEPRELPDALIAWFTLRARSLQATFDLNLAVLSLARATGRDLESVLGR